MRAKERLIWLSVFYVSGYSFWRLGSLESLHGNSSLTACFEGGEFLYNMEDLEVEGEVWKVAIKVLQVANAKTEKLSVFYQGKTRVRGADFEASYLGFGAEPGGDSSWRR
ncbi:unnamed protein product [Linum trigynum]|uniref:Uncharacterized protein n=1 Tax=Linum trigynum TaxID=586398 RepID=A0AAV2G2C4_9ROSI